MPGASKYSYLLKQYPETVQKEQFRIMCHISKRTARYLLQAGLVPCAKREKDPKLYDQGKRYCSLSEPEGNLSRKIQVASRFV